MTETTKPSTFQRWYAKNREKFNAKRRKRYKKDPLYREKVLSVVRQKRRKVRANRPKPSGYTVTHAAIRLGRTAQTVRRWEALGYIPETFDERGIRRYSDHQVALMKRLVKAVTMFKHHQLSQAQLNSLTKEIKANWNGN